MDEGETSRGERERRSARRFEARHVARLQFVTPLSDVSGVEGTRLWPTIICQTRDVSERGLALLVPALREDDENFFGVEGPVRVTVSLPTGAVEVGAATARYERGGPEPGSFLVCVEIADEEGAAAESWVTYFRGRMPDDRPSEG